MLSPKTMAKATIGTMGNTLPVPGNSQETASVSVLKDQNQCSEGGRNRQQVQRDSLHCGEKRSEPAQKRQQRPTYDQRHYGSKPVPDNRLIIGIECRDASNAQRGAGYSRESRRAGLAQLPTQFT